MSSLRRSGGPLRTPRDQPMPTETVRRHLSSPVDWPRLRRFLDDEFPSAARLADNPDRRSFLRLMAASFALAGLTGCDDPDGRGHEVPYVRQPERMLPGAFMRFASATLLDGVATGVVVRTCNGRPIKIEGNEAHPWARGGTDVFAQASVLGLYDPDRSQSVRYLDRISDWASFAETAIGDFSALRANGGAGLRILTGPITSPTTLARIAAMKAAFPEMHWHSYAPCDRTATYAGTKLAFGTALETRWRFDRADVVVSLDGDFLDAGPQQVGVTRDWIDARRTAAKNGKLLAMHATAATPTLTSAKADYHEPAGPSATAALAAELLAEIGGHGGDDAGPLVSFRKRAAAALLGARGRSIVLTGIAQSPMTQLAVLRINEALGNLGQTVFFTQPLHPQTETLPELAEAMERGEVQVLLIMDANPAYDAPADLAFVERLSRVPLKIHAGLYDDETAVHCDWHLPLAHPLESWDDARSFDGTVTILQPTIAPLYGGRTIAELLSMLTEPLTPQNGLALVQAQWSGQQSKAAFATRWREALLHGFLPDTAFAPESPQWSASTPPIPSIRATTPDVLEIALRPDPAVWDGRFANNPWLQELPKPLTKLTWSNVISIAPSLAARAKLNQGDQVAVTVGDRHLEGPVWIAPGQAEDTIAVTLGYGRTAFTIDQPAPGIGYNAYVLREAAFPWHQGGATLRRKTGKEQLATTQIFNTMEGHDLVRTQELGAKPAGDNTAFTQPSFYDSTTAFSDGRSWGMVIDLDACIGCNACVVACQAENNIPVVGPDQVRAGRIMHWLRIDRYYKGSPENPDVAFLPVPCMHCENAPCEVGCPVEATLHDHEGLNLQVYNRCVGTRACSSYCPYKVRRFNWFDYTADTPASVEQQRNPDVTVRSRGVMEKCTYCIQRIAEARIVADQTNTPIPIEGIQTACQNACPTRAIIFGDLNRQGSKVSTARNDPRNYALLGELNTRPHTTYLARYAPAPTAKQQAS